MKKNAILLSAGLTLFTGSAMALNPVNGWYAGFIGDVSYMGSLDFTVLNLDTIRLPNGGTAATTTGLPGSTLDSQINYRVMGGGGGQLGYRFCDRYRAELEVFFNTNEYNLIQFGNYGSIDRATSINQDIGLNQNGRTNIITGMLNGYFDFYNPRSEGYFVPYVGLGIGYASVQNRLVLNYNAQEVYRASLTKSGFAAQVIAGLSYFLDDFTSFNVDYRYYSTNKISETNTFFSFNQRFAIQTVNISMNFAFDKTL